LSNEKRVLGVPTNPNQLLVESRILGVPRVLKQLSAERTVLGVTEVLTVEESSELLVLHWFQLTV
jgi:hypothetical protein